MPRLARVFLRGEMPRCAKCGRPHFLVLLGDLLVCSSRGKDRSQCNVAHYAMADPTGSGSIVVMRVTEEEVQRMKDGNVGDVLLELGLPQLAQQMLDGVGSHKAAA